MFLVKSLHNMMKASNKFNLYSALFKIRHFAKDKKKALIVIKKISKIYNDRMVNCFRRLDQNRHIQYRLSSVEDGLDILSGFRLNKMKKLFL